ncbi:MAG: hypothetical protein GY853_01460 [PVC group bacterium]|nr:hypothetical protein [PVC group bacterium]
MEEQNCGCACSIVKYKPTISSNGTYNERWECNSCGANFKKEASILHKHELSAVGEDKIAEMQKKLKNVLYVLQQFYLHTGSDNENAHEQYYNASKILDDLIANGI